MGVLNRYFDVKDKLKNLETYSIIDRSSGVYIAFANMENSAKTVLVDEDVTQPMSNILQTIKTVVLSLQLLDEKCFQTLVIDSNYLDVPCLKLFVSRGLGTAIVAGSILVKFPQIIKILSSGDAAGLSFIGVLLELLAVTANGAYSFSQGFPFTAYGEAVFMSFQTSIIAILILWYGGNTLTTILFSAAYGAIVFAITQPGLVPDDVLWYGQAANIPMIVVGKLIQAATNYKNGHTGQLSAITVFLLTAGSLARIFTSIQETGDQVMILTFVVSSSVNVIIALQVLYYWNTTKQILKAEAKKKKSKKTN